VGSRYGLVLQEVKLLDPKMYREYEKNKMNNSTKTLLKATKTSPAKPK
jgi:hypothetical protein